MSKIFKLKMRPSQFAEAFIPIQGQPFRFEDPDPKRRWNWRAYLRVIYDNMYRKIVLKTARQVEKSTTQANRYITYSALIPYFRSVYVTPTSKQSRVFSNDRLRKSIRTSPFIKKYFVNSSTTDQVFEQSFINESTIFIGYAYLTADTMRGISADMLGLDEFQDLLSDNVPVLREMLEASPYKLEMYTGTPKTLDNHLEKEWQASFQAVWVIKCEHCKAWNRLDEEPLKLIGKTGLICKKCRKSIYTQNGRWVKTNPQSQVAGFHISQLQTGRKQRPADWQDLLHKVENYPEPKLYNEVFGLSFDSAFRPITETMMRRVSTGPFLETLDISITKGIPLFLGVDWGENKGSFTVVVIGGFIEPKRFQVFYIRKFSPRESKNPDYVLFEIGKLFNGFRCMAMGLDHGAGHKENLRLQQSFGPERVIEIYHTNQQKLWNYNAEKGIYTTDRTSMMDNLIIPIQEGSIIFPFWGEVMGRPIDFDDGRRLADDFIAITREYSEQLRKFKYDHESPDDAFHATLYAKFTAHLFTNTPFI